MSAATASKDDGAAELLKRLQRMTARLERYEEQDYLDVAGEAELAWLKATFPGEAIKLDRLLAEGRARVAARQREREHQEYLAKEKADQEEAEAKEAARRARWAALSRFERAFIYVAWGPKWSYDAPARDMFRAVASRIERRDTEDLEPPPQFERPA